MGSVAPISSSSARLLAHPIQTNDKVLELGPGTGVATKEIIKKTPANQIFGIELGEEFIQPLQSSFPGATIYHGDARMDGKDFFQDHLGTFSVVVSTLPLRCMSSQDQKQAISAALSMLKEDGIFVQITSYLRAPAFDPKKFGLVAELVGRADYYPTPWAIWSFKRKSL